MVKYLPACKRVTSISVLWREGAHRIRHTLLTGRGKLLGFQGDGGEVLKAEDDNSNVLLKEAEVASRAVCFFKCNMLGC